MHLPKHFLFRVAGAVAGVGGITMLCSRVFAVNAATTGYCYLILILAVATVWGLAEAAVSSVVAMLCYNFYFLPPLGQFTIADSQNWVALITFLTTALVASHLSDRAKQQTLEATRRQQETERLYALSRAILLTDAALPIGPQAAQQIAQIFGAEGVSLYDAKNSLTFRGGPVELPGIEPALKQVVRLGSPQRDESAGVEIWPILLGGHAIGALATKGFQASDSAVQALLNLVAIALERVHTEEAANKAEIARQSEEFKSTLLDAIAHEFKTPLTSIKAASTSLRGADQGLRADQKEMAAIIDEEADRLSLLVTEAVKMSQIDAGKLKLERVVVAPLELVRTAANSFSSRGDERIEIAGSWESVPPVCVDAEMIALALRQLIDNGLKYSPPAARISLQATVARERVEIRIIDRGPGIPERDRERVFEKFFRRANVREKIPGSGLGLHIAREIVRAHGGDLWVEDGDACGAHFCMALPVAGERGL